VGVSVTHGVAGHRDGDENVDGVGRDLEGLNGLLVKVLFVSIIGP
jgi:hypothetical protein